MDAPYGQKGKGVPKKLPSVPKGQPFALPAGSGGSVAARAGSSSVGGVSASHRWRLAAVNSATVISGGRAHAPDQIH